MLVLPNDSGYNSPCDGIAPSSLYSPSEKFSKPDIDSQVRRKLRFESHTCWNSGKSRPSVPLHRSHLTPFESSSRSQEIARRLVRICDLFEKEFAEASEVAEHFTWATSILRLIGF